MTNPKLAYQTPGGSRRYRSPRNPGVEYISVTSVAKSGIPAHGLNASILRLAIEWSFDNVAVWKAIIEHDREAAIKLARNASERAWGPKRDRGTEVHQVLERMVKGEDVGSWDDLSIGGYLESAKAFFDDFKPSFRLVELTVFNDLHAYAGTLDFMCVFDKAPHLGLILGDYKTGSSGVWPDYALQLAAYAHADYGITDDGEVIDLNAYRPDKGMLVHLGPDGYSVTEARIDDQAFAYFLSALDISRWCGGAGRKYLLGTVPKPELPAHEWDVLALIHHIKALDLEHRLALSIQMTDAGIGTIPAKWTEDEGERILGFIRDINLQLRGSRI